MKENRAICALDLQINKVYDFEILMILKTQNMFLEKENISFASPSYHYFFSFSNMYIGENSI